MFLFVVASIAFVVVDVAVAGAASNGNVSNAQFV